LKGCEAGCGGGGGGGEV
jgi:hypothetical protein